MKRGDIVGVAVQGDFGKPRPVLVIQANNLLKNATSVTFAPLTSAQEGIVHTRVTILPSPANGLRRPSHVMVDKIQTARIEKIGLKIGVLDTETMLQVDRALLVFLGIV